MSHELICCWLGIPADAWPPDHYRLLGLEPGEGDMGLIEQRVHQRLDAVRRYQMMHPEQATEAMNRLAQAFVCLTDPGAKRAYDLALLGPRARVAPPPPPPPLPVEPRDPLVWLYTPGMTGPRSPVPPPPVRLPPTVRVEDAPPPPAPPPVSEAPPAPPEPPAPPPEPVDPVVEAARASHQARVGLSTRRALYQRVARTRHLQRLWHRLGKHLQDPEKKLAKAEAADLAKLVEQTEDALDDFPLLGEAGQPGYLIVSLGQLDRKRDLQNLAVSQRESLARDWKAGLKFLESHRDFLRVELRKDRHRTRSERLVRACRAYLNEQPLCAVLVLLALTAIVIAVWRSWLGA
jgi:hypothetical protein